MPRLRRLISTAAVALALLASGCNRESNATPAATLAAAAAPAPDPGAAEPSPAVSPVAASDANAAAAPTPLAADVPIYGAAPPVSSMASAELGTVVNLRSDDAAEQVAAWYGAELPARGWELEKQSGAAGSYLLIAHKERRKATVLITGGAQGTQILTTVLEDR